LLELLDLLVHPSRWNTVGELSPGLRALTALIIFTLTAALGALLAMWSARYARGRDISSTGATARAAAKVQRGLVALLAFVGIDVAVDVAPLPAKLETVIGGVAFVVAALAGARVVINLVALLVGTSVTHVHAGERERLEREYLPLLSKITTLAVALILVIVVAKHFGKDVTSLIAALGVGSLAIGLAAQQTLGNMIAGFTLLFDRPFRVGDRIQLATGEQGDVMEIGVRSTRICTPSRNLLIVPNAELVNSRVVNFHFPTEAARGEVRVTIGYGSDVERAAQILAELAAAEERVAAEPAPVARVVQLAASGVEIALGFEVKSHSDVAAVEDGLRRALLRRFPVEKIELPFPRTDVFLINK
jgi:small-conductance mechanosensitive channel